jgi:signal transduction histidine kinase
MSLVAASPLAEGSSKRPSVLVVDDVDANIVAIEALLSNLDCEVVKASSGQAALLELLRRDFACVLLDVQMPEMDGFEVAKLARGNPRGREVPIIFVTAMLETSENIFAGYSSGAVDVLFKPIEPQILLSKVRIFLDLYRSKQRLASEVAAHERTLAELDAFNYSVSHDLRAPLRHITGFSKILTEDYGPNLDDEGKRLLSRVVAGAHRMDQLISDLLRLSRIARAKPVAKPLDLAVLANRIIAELRGTDPTRKVDVTVCDSMKAVGDEQLLTIALENLLRNAWKFTSKTAAPKIEVGHTRTAKEQVFHVKDNGAGFDPSGANRLFAPFQRLHSQSEFDGTGIGLAIVQRIIHHHRGRVWAESSPNEGATFFFTLGA